MSGRVMVPGAKYRVPLFSSLGRTLHGASLRPGPCPARLLVSSRLSALSVAVNYTAVTSRKGEEGQVLVATVHTDTAIDAVVAEAAVAAYVARGNRVLDIPLIEMVHVSVGADVATVRSIVAVEDRVVELVVDDGPFEALGPAVWALAARGWDVVALIPSRRNGEAHRALRGTPCRIQPWWAEDGEIRFGGLEIP